jgi:hypothetical protein
VSGNTDGRWRSGEEQAIDTLGILPTACYGYTMDVGNGRALS